ncbi:hypothetical protein LDENG_00088350, partial [Lucifuga dentata]
VQNYDPVSNRWNIAAECPQPWRYTAAAVLGSQIFIMGGDTEFTAASAYRFDCDTNQWTRVGDMTSKRMSCHALELHHHRALLSDPHRLRQHLETPACLTGRPEVQVLRAVQVRDKHRHVVTAAAQPPRLNAGRRDYFSEIP